MQPIDLLRHRGAALIHDLLMIPVAWLGAYWLRFNLDVIPHFLWSEALTVLPLVIVVQGMMFWYFGLYRGVWRFASMPDLIRILKAVVIGTSLMGILVFFLTRMHHIPRSVFPLHVLLLMLLLGGPRLAYRWVKEHHLHAPPKQTVLIVGAGRAGEILVRTLLKETEYGYYPAAFVDDDPRKKEREIHGVRVVDTCDGIPRLVETLGIVLVLLAVPSASGRQMRRLVGLCEMAHVPFRTLPRMQDLLSGKSVLKELREVAIDDLLGREPVRLDWARIGAAINGRVVLVTGGGGSIGAELCRQIAGLAPRCLVIFDQSEFNLYAIELELRTSSPELNLHVVLGDVCDRIAVDDVMKQHSPDLLFHAAAYKHVPMLEAQARQAVRNNVFGTLNVALSAVNHGKGTFVLISSDKAVNPCSVMGASKRAAEILCHSIGCHYRTIRFVTVRFGNVLDSAGSVVPLFRKQIARGGPVTVTHSHVKRFFMTIPEASQLILNAAAIGNGNEVFVLDMGEPIPIRYLAEQMIVLAGKIPGEDIELVYTGLRPGEKLNEELFHNQEGLQQTAHTKILLATHHSAPSWPLLNAFLEELSSACNGSNDIVIRATLAKIVPEFGSGTSIEGTSNVISLGVAKR